METEPKAYVIFAGQVVESCATLEEANAIAEDMRVYWSAASLEERESLGWADCNVHVILSEIYVKAA